jgi:hypothetical protein
VAAQNVVCAVVMEIGAATTEIVVIVKEADETVMFAEPEMFV